MSFKFIQRGTVYHSFLPFPLPLGQTGFIIPKSLKQDDIHICMYKCIFSTTLAGPHPYSQAITNEVQSGMSFRLGWCDQGLLRRQNHPDHLQTFLPVLPGPELGISGHPSLTLILVSPAAFTAFPPCLWS